MGTRKYGLETCGSFIRLHFSNVLQGQLGCVIFRGSEDLIVLFQKWERAVQDDAGVVLIAFLQQASTELRMPILS